MLDKIRRHKKLYYFLLSIQHIYYAIYFGFFMTFFKLFRIKNNKIVISSFYGKGYGDNPKYVCDELLKKSKDLDIVWIVKDYNDKSIPEGIRKAKHNSIKALYELSTAKVWIDNSRKTYHTRKRKNQYYIQLWHGSMMFKKIEFDVADKLGKFYVRNMKKDNKMIDLFVTNSEFFTKKVRETFKYTGEVLECGEPRSDELMKNHVKMGKDFREKNNYVGKKIIMYAPTFRANYGTEAYDIDYEKLYNSLENKQDYVIFIRLHPNISSDKIKINFNDHIIDMCKYPNMHDLIAASDIVITDYSSSMFEAMLIDKKVVIYASDIDEYSDDRGFYFEFSELPFPLTKNTKELIKCINSDKLYDKKKYTDFKNMINLTKKLNSSKVVADIIIKKTQED